MPSTIRRLTAALLFGTLLVASAGPLVTVGDAAATPHDAPDGRDGNVTVLRGAGDLHSTLDDTGDLRAARADGRLRPATHVVPGDLLVLQFRSERFAETYAATEGANATDRLFRTLNETGADLRVEGRDHGVEQLPAEVRLDRRAVRVLYDPGNATFSLLVDTDAVTVVDRTDGDPLQRGLDHLEFEAVVDVPTDDGGHRTLVGSSRFSRPAATVRSPTRGVHLDVRPATVGVNVSRFVVNGTATLLPGSNLSVAAVAPNGTVLAEEHVQTTARGGPDDPFGHSGLRTTLDVGSLAADAAFDLVVTGAEPIEERRVVVGDPPRMWNTSAELVTEGDRAGQVAVTTSLRVPADGFLLAYVDGEPVATPVRSDVRVQPTLYVDERAVDPERGAVSVYAIWDSDGDGVVDREDSLFRTNADFGASQADDELDARVQVAGWPNGTSAGSPTDRSSGTTSPTGTASSAPGFGASAAVFAVVIVSLLLRRL